jgi:hypothetical protein
MRVTRAIRVLQMLEASRNASRFADTIENAILAKSSGLCLVNIKGSAGLILTKASVTCEDFHTP